MAIDIVGFHGKKIRFPGLQPTHSRECLIPGILHQLKRSIFRTAIYVKTHRGGIGLRFPIESDLGRPPRKAEESN